MKDSAKIDSIFSASRIIPVITIDAINDAIPMAEALVSGGLRVLEITLRTSCALQAIEEIAARVPDAIVGAGTIITKQDLDNVTNAGAVFAISPGATEALYDAAEDASIPFLPGISTASELMRGIERGYERFKFFPAEAAGGSPLLKSLAGPFSQAKFCPTGGITVANARDYLALPNVMGVGGSWMLPASSIKARDWGRLHELATQASHIHT